MMRSAISGTGWAGIAVLMAIILGGGFDVGRMTFGPVGRITWGLRGGILAAPP